MTVMLRRTVLTRVGLERPAETIDARLAAGLLVRLTAVMAQMAAAEEADLTMRELEAQVHRIHFGNRHLMAQRWGRAVAVAVQAVTASRRTVQTVVMVEATAQAAAVAGMPTLRPRPLDPVAMARKASSSLSMNLLSLSPDLTRALPFSGDCNERRLTLLGVN